MFYSVADGGPGPGGVGGVSRSPSLMLGGVTEFASPRPVTS